MKKVFLCILDGFGLGDESFKHNAVYNAKMPNLRRFLATYPYTFLKTSGLDVGLPEGQMGNSEVGHMTIGSGRVLMQDLPKIDSAISSGTMWRHSTIAKNLNFLKQSAGAFHILGLASNGGVHSHINHITAVANYFAENGVSVWLHLISDGRDVPPETFIKDVKSIKIHSNVQIATICGRFFTMDRDKKLERTSEGINAITTAIGKSFTNPIAAVQECYNNGITDEFITPLVNENYAGASKKDVLFFANFRADRARQPLKMLLDNNIFSEIFTMMPYEESLINKATPLFVKEDIVNTLSEVLSKNGISQFKIAETEKYAHITFFFNGGKEELLPLETREIIPSPAVKTYDLQPEMSLPEVESKLLTQLDSQKHGFIACNIANGDMVGHTGNFAAAIKACERIDEFLGKIEESCLKNNYTLLITADHGNVEEMLDENGNIHTQHTTKPVPLFIVSKEQYTLKNGSLANIAPTILQLMGIKKPDEMSFSLIP